MRRLCQSRSFQGLRKRFKVTVENKMWVTGYLRISRFFRVFKKIDADLDLWYSFNVSDRQWQERILMKKGITMALLAIAGAFAVYMAFFFGRLRFSDLLANEGQLESIMESRRLGDSSLIGTVFFDDQELSFDGTTDTFYYSPVEGSRSAYNPYVRKTADKTVSVAVNDAKITAEDIRDNKTFRMIAWNDDFYYEYNLKCTALPLMNIDCDEEIGDEDVAMSMTLFDNRTGVMQRVTQSEGSIHVRGGSTSAYPKKGYKLSLSKTSSEGETDKNKISLLGMRRDDDWVLYAAYNDPEKIRNVFSSNLWKYTCAKDNSLDIDNGVEYKYIELFVNNEYWGLYALGYKPDSSQLEIDTSAGERLYKKYAWDSEEYILSAPNAAVSGYETDETAENAWAKLKEYYTKLHAQWTDSKSMYEGIDIDNAIDMYLFINLIQGLDHTGVLSSLSIKNMYLSFHNSNGREIMLYTPWDMDITWGMQWTGDSETNMVKPYGTPADQNTVMGLGNLEALILNGDDMVRELILDKYRTLRKRLWSEEYINKLLDEYEEDIYGSGAYLRDMERWPQGSRWDADKGLSDFRSYVSERLRETDEYYGRVEELVAGENPTKNVYIIRSAQYKDFLQSDFILALTDKELLGEADYREFLEYIGIDADRLDGNICYAVVNGAEQTVQYFETLDAPEGTDTCIGRLCVTGAGFYVDGVLWREADTDAGVQLVFGTDADAGEFDFSREYVMWSYLCEQQEPEVWCEEVLSSGGDVVIEIVNHAAIREEKLMKLLEGFGVDPSDISESTDFIVINNAQGTVTALCDSHESGTRADTVLGAFSLFYNDEGGYGVYLDGNECMLVQPQDNEGVDVRVAELLSEPYEVLWCPTFTY